MNSEVPLQVHKCLCLRMPLHPKTWRGWEMDGVFKRRRSFTWLSVGHLRPLQRYLAHQRTPTPLETPQFPKLRATVESYRGGGLMREVPLRMQVDFAGCILSMRRV